MFWIHGGAFTGGEGGDGIFDGGNMTSRGDRGDVLGTQGFLALDDGVTNGNFGIADQITALQWVHDHNADFGRDPNLVNPQGLAPSSPYSQPSPLSISSKAQFPKAVSADSDSRQRTRIISQSRRVSSNSVHRSLLLFIVVDTKFFTTNQLEVNGVGPAAKAHKPWNLPFLESGCIDQATLISAAKHKVFPTIFAYQFDRSYGGFEPIPGTCVPPATAEFPNGDTSLPYFRCHSGEFFYMFGTLGQNQQPFCDDGDLVMTKVSVDIWTSFARSFDPTPSFAFLNAR
ncbi:Alpha/Beta hydrolase protein [Flammula alnicola]|nr:Alpha/Beta hydrolase protein [Flammula alnicola]